VRRFVLGVAASRVSWGLLDVEHGS
jgi:hypothetical protein